MRMRGASDPTAHAEMEAIRSPRPGSGPDFLEPKIKIGNTTWAGNIELHFKTSDWEKHNHHKDHNYNNVILHVVWEHDISNQNPIPVLELKERVSKILLQRYDELLKAITFIPCESGIHLVKDIIWKSWKERLLAERLIKKSKIVEKYLCQSNYHWEEVFWWLLARNFGMKVNADAFEEMARSISIASSCQTQKPDPPARRVIAWPVEFTQPGFRRRLSKNAEERI